MSGRALRGLARDDRQVVAWAGLSVLCVALNIVVAVLGLLRPGRLRSVWPPPSDTFDRVLDYVGTATAQQYVWYMRRKLTLRLGYLLVILSMLGSALWGDHSSRRVVIVAGFSAVAVVIVIRSTSSYWTVRAFSRALNIPRRRGWDLPLFRTDKLLERLDELSG